MEKLWAPWRMKYIEVATTSQEDEGCVLCGLPQQGDDAATYILHRGEKNYVVLNKFPYNAGHLMVVPFRHVASLDGLTTEERNEHFEIVCRALEVLREVFKAQGFNTGTNIGRTAGAGIEGHVHTHIVPRWNGDSNFMPVLADTKIINEALAETYCKLAGRF